MTEFKVQLDGIKLTNEASARIQTGIQRLVLQELAVVDQKGDLLVKRPFKFFGRLLGLIARSEAGKIVVADINQGDQANK